MWVYNLLKINFKQWSKQIFFSQFFFFLHINLLNQPNEIKKGLIFLKKIDWSWKSYWFFNFFKTILGHSNQSNHQNNLFSWLTQTVRHKIW